MDQRGRGCRRGRGGRGQGQSYRGQFHGGGENHGYGRGYQDGQQERFGARDGHYENQTFSRGGLSNPGGRGMNRGNLHSNRGQGNLTTRMVNTECFEPRRFGVQNQPGFCQQPAGFQPYGPGPNLNLNVPPPLMNFHPNQSNQFGMVPNAEEWEITYKIKRHPDAVPQQPTSQQNVGIPAYQNMPRSQSVQHIGPRNIQRPHNAGQTAPRDSHYQMSRSSSVQNMVDKTVTARVNSSDRGRRANIARDNVRYSKEGINQVNDEDIQKRDREGNQANGACSNNMTNRQLRNRGGGRGRGYRIGKGSGRDRADSDQNRHTDSPEDRLKYKQGERQHERTTGAVSGGKMRNSSRGRGRLVQGKNSHVTGNQVGHPRTEAKTSSISSDSDDGEHDKENKYDEKYDTKHKTMNRHARGRGFHSRGPLRGRWPHRGTGLGFRSQGRNRSDSECSSISDVSTLNDSMETLSNPKPIGDPVRAGTDGIDTISIQTLKNRINRYKKKISALKSEKGNDAPEVLKLQKEVSDINDAVEKRIQNEKESKMKNGKHHDMEVKLDPSENASKMTTDADSQSNGDSEDSSLKYTSRIQHRKRKNLTISKKGNITFRPKMNLKMHTASKRRPKIPEKSIDQIMTEEDTETASDSDTGLSDPKKENIIDDQVKNPNTTKPKRKNRNRVRKKKTATVETVNDVPDWQTMLEGLCSPETVDKENGMTAKDGVKPKIIKKQIGETEKLNEEETVNGRIKERRKRNLTADASSRKEAVVEETTDNEKRNQTQRRKRTGSSLSEGSVDGGPEEVEIFKFLVREMKGEGCPEDIKATCSQFNDYQGGVDEWFRRHSRKFTIFQKENIVVKISVFVKDAEYCVDYITRNQCTKSGCHRYHFCKHLLSGRCIFGERCKFSHDSFDEHNAPISSQLGFSNVFNNDEIIQLVSLRYPHVCNSWNEKGACSDEMCCKLHICQRHVFGDCLEGDGCPFEHSLETVQNQMIRRAFRMTKWVEKIFFRMIFTPRRPMDHARNIKELAPSSVFPEGISGRRVSEAAVVETNVEVDEETASRPAPRPVPRPAPRKLHTRPERETRHPNNTDDAFIKADSSGSKYICEKHVAGRCDNNACTNYHGDTGGLPYIWQIKLYGKWVSLPSQQAVEVETDFCSWKSKSGANQLASEDGLYQGYNIVFGYDIHAYTKHLDIDGEKTRTQARRLSTPSYAEGEMTNGTFKTQWRWSWADDRGSVQLFETDKFQYTLEKKYLAGQKKYLYSRENYRFKYCLEFGAMNQVNLDTWKKRKVFRRPLLVTKEDALQRKYPLDLQPPPTISVSLPQGWIDWDLAHPFELVELEPSNKAYNEVEDHFYKTLDRNTQIIDRVYRVQNPILWSAFINHKENMTANAERAGRGAVVQELLLFHGTDSLDTVRGIAINNFDHRLSGKNATMYGEGAYFAKNAKYSHAYTKPPDRFMFLARVLVSEYTKGDRSFKRPPAKPGAAHELYDSCVDNMASPSIYIVFDYRQHYPELLVQYHSLDKVSDDFGIIRPVPRPVQGRTPAVAQVSASTPTAGPTYRSAVTLGLPSATGYQGSIKTVRAPSPPRHSYPSTSMTYPTTNRARSPSPVRTMYPSASASYPTSQSSTRPRTPSPPPVLRSATVNMEPRKNKDDSCVVQ